jgi:hypothetical protein
MSTNSNRDFPSTKDFVWNAHLKQLVLTMNTNALDDQSQRQTNE